MDPLHVHLMLNHVPVVGSAFAAALLLYGLVRGKDEVMRVALVAIVALAAFTFAVVRTGEAAEDAAERIPGVVESAIHPHEEAGEAALIAGIVAGVLALGFLVLARRRERLLRAGAALVLLAIVLSFGLAGYAANLGGKIRHTELGGPQAQAEEHAEQQGEEQGERRGRRGRDH